jgi:hypothetical protein
MTAEIGFYYPTTTLRYLATQMWLNGTWAADIATCFIELQAASAKFST